MGSFQVNSASESLQSISHDVAGYPGVRIQVVEPDRLSVDEMPDDIVPQQAILSGVELYAARLPCQFHILPAHILNEV